LSAPSPIAGKLPPKKARGGEKLIHRVAKKHKVNQ
jgi:hypothetical protein